MNSKSLLLGAALAAVIAQSAYADLKAGDDVPDLSAFKLEGKLPDALKGKVILLDFWASWCGPCKESFPVMNDLFKHYRDRGFVIIGVNEDEVRADMEHFLAGHTAEFSVVRDPAQKLADRVGLGSMPSSLLIDRNGKIKYLHSGFHGEKSQKAYIQEIESLLGKEN